MPDTLIDEHADLQLTLMTAQSVQESIRHADSKATTFLTAHIALAALTLPTWPNQMLDTIDIWDVLVRLMFGLTTAIGCMTFTIALWPRTTGLPIGNRFGLTPLSYLPTLPSHPRMEAARKAAWQLTVLLATIATRKHNWVRRGVPWLGFAALSMLASFVQ